MNAGDIANELYAALRARRTVPPLRTRLRELDVDTAYAVSLAFLERRLADGERLTGKKIGVTSAAVQQMLGVDQPDFGFLTDAMEVPDGATVRIADALIQPRAEAEIAFRLHSDLGGTHVSEADVRAAVETVMPCFEIVDSRIDAWDIAIVDTVADNASCGVFALGPEIPLAPDLDLAAVHCTMSKNGRLISEGYGAAVQGSPLASVAWLANTLGRYGVTLNAGDIILSGSLVPLEPAQVGDRFEMRLSDIGTASLSFA